VVVLTASAVRSGASATPAKNSRMEAAIATIAVTAQPVSALSNGRARSMLGSISNPAIRNSIPSPKLGRKFNVTAGCTIHQE